jgi:hypothetical protein
MTQRKDKIITGIFLTAAELACLYRYAAEDAGLALIGVLAFVILLIINITA